MTLKSICTSEEMQGAFQRVATHFPPMIEFSCVTICLQRRGEGWDVDRGGRLSDIPINLSDFSLSRSFTKWKARLCVDCRGVAELCFSRGVIIKLTSFLSKAAPEGWAVIRTLCARNPWAVVKLVFSEFLSTKVWIIYKRHRQNLLLCHSCSKGQHIQMNLAPPGGGEQEMKVGDLLKDFFFLFKCIWSLTTAHKAIIFQPYKL